MNKQELQRKANEVRKGIVTAVHAAKAGHPGGSLSAADIFTYLYFEELNIDPKDPKKPDRDRFVLSKGHSAPGLYSALALRGYFPVEDLKTLRHLGSYLQGGTTQLTAGLGQLGSQLSDGSAKLSANSGSLRSGASQVASGASQLASGASTLANGTSSLASGASELNSGASTLASGASTLASGASTLANGTSSLASGASDLKSGSSKVVDGIDELSDGAKELADGTKKFEEEGTSKLKSTFEDDLGDVLDRIQALNSDKCAYTSYSGKANGMDGSVKFINLLTDSLPAIALGMEPHYKAVMDQKPRPVNESILTKAYLVNIGTEGLCIGIMTMAAFLIGYRGQGAVLASTMAFGTLCMSRLVHGFNCKDDKPVIFSKRFFNNKYLIGAFVLGTVLITGVLTIPGLHAMFKVVTLNMTQLMTVYGLAFLNLPVIQGLKYLKGKTKWN